MSNALLIQPYALSSVTATNTDAGYSASNLTTDYMGMTWQYTTGGGGAQSFVVDLGSDKSIDSVVLLGISGVLVATTWDVYIATAAQGSTFGPSTTAFTGAQLWAGSLLTSGSLAKALGTFGAITGRYVKITITPPGGYAFRMARIIIGDGVTLATNFVFGASFGVKPLGSLDFSARGVLLRRSGTKLRALSITFPAASRSEVETSIQPMLEVLGNDSPLCIVTDTDSDAQRINRIYFGFLTGSLGTVWARLGGFTADFNMVCID